MFGKANDPESDKYVFINLQPNIISFIRTCYIKLVRIVSPQHKKTSNTSNSDVSVINNTKLAEMKSIATTCKKLEQMYGELKKENRGLKEENEKTKLSVAKLQSQIIFLSKGFEKTKLTVKELQDKFYQANKTIQKLQNYKKRPNQKTYKYNKPSGLHRYNNVPYETPPVYYLRPPQAFYGPNNFRPYPNKYKPTIIPRPLRNEGLTQRTTYFHNY